MSPFNSNILDWEKDRGLLPAVVQDANTGTVLMLGYMNKVALETTLKTKKVTFFSRSRQALWVKGETSGNYLNLISIAADCDNDSLLITANPDGPTCHLNTPSCFKNNDNHSWQILPHLEAVIAQRKNALPHDSYTSALINEGINKVAQKVGEEAVETVIAALKENDKSLCNEMADLLYHALVLLQCRELSIADVLAVLKSRSEKSGSS